MGNKKELKLICPYCGKSFSVKMKNTLEDSISLYESCGFGEVKSVVEIYCEHCKKLVYKKETMKDLDLY